MSVEFSATPSIFLIEIDGNTVLTKDKANVYVCVSPVDSTIVEIWETIPHQNGRTLVFSSVYTNFTTPSAASAALLVDELHAILQSNITTIISMSSVVVGDPVTGGTSKALLYKDVSGNLASSHLKHENDAITIPIGVYYRAEGGVASIDFGVAGDEINLTSNGIYTEAGLGLNPSEARLYFPSSEVKLDGVEIHIYHATKIRLNSAAYNFSQLTATTVPYLDASKNLVSSAVTPTELGHLSGVTSAIQTQLANKQPLDGDLTSWAGVTRASGFDTFATTPSSANLASLLTDESGTGLVLFGSGTAVDFSGTASPTGFSSATVTYAQYWRVGASLYIVQLDVTGTSNAATFTVTLPFNAAKASATPCRITDNGALQAAVGVVTTTAGSPTLTFGKAFTAVAGFTASNTKRAQVATLIIEA